MLLVCKMYITFDGKKDILLTTTEMQPHQINLNPILPGVLVHPHFTWGQKSLNPLIPEIVLLRAYSRKITWPAVAIQIISPA